MFVIEMERLTEVGRGMHRRSKDFMWGTGGPRIGGLPWYKLWGLRLFLCVSHCFTCWFWWHLNYLRKVDLLKQACFIAAACPLLLVFWWPLGVWYSSLPNNPDPLHYRELLRVFWDLCGFHSTSGKTLLWAETGLAGPTECFEGAPR